MVIIMDKKDKKCLLRILEELPESKDTKRLIKKLNKELKPISVSSRKSKGREFQKFICDKISCKLKEPWGYEDEMSIQPRLMGQSGVDIVLRGRARQEFPFAIEAKNQENLSLWNTIEQAIKNQGDFQYWIVMHKKNGKTPIAILDLDDFLNIYFENKEE